MRLVLSFFFCLPLLINGQKPLAERIANYDIDVTLEPSTKTLWASQKLTWINTSNDEISKVPFHMYMNAFKNDESTFMKESGGKHRNNRLDKKGLNYGNIYLTSLKTQRGENLFDNKQYIQPDDENENDETVLEVTMERPILPGDTIVFEMDFRVKLPQIFARTGFAEGDYFLVGQWFPKIGVYEQPGTRYAEKGQWNCHQFHANSEFYADFGVYNVNITIPKRFVVGSTGSLLETEELNDSLKVLKYRAEDVHDFAWTADPNFIEIKEKWDGLELIALMQPSHENQAQRYFNSVKQAIQYFNDNLGPYPYPTLTMVDPPLNGQGSGGMEYPRFITCGYLTYGMPSSIKMPEVVTIHEFGHQYFQGMLASNEFEESWLDEGFNTYYEWRIMKDFYEGVQANFFGFELPSVGSARASYVGMKNPEITEVFRNTWQYPKGSYGIMSYSKTGLWMSTLENLVGRELMDKAMKAYFNTYKFRHPSGGDFVKVFNETVPPIEGRENYDWFFEQALYKSYSGDYSVDSVYYAGSEVGYEVKISRKGKFVFPQVVELHFADGSSESITWNGLDSEWYITREKEIVAALIDPQRKNLMDLDLINNSYTTKPSQQVYWKYLAKVLFWVQGVLEFFASWV